jgi:hypothetical protein
MNQVLNEQKKSKNQIKKKDCIDKDKSLFEKHFDKDHI